MTVIGPAGGFPPGFYNVTAPKWCRHKEQFVTTVVSYNTATGVATGSAVCSNCAADTGTLTLNLAPALGVDAALDAIKKAVRDALLKIEKVAIVSEIAP